jgi:hypothetical protein
VLTDPDPKQAALNLDRYCALPAPGSRRPKAASFLETHTRASGITLHEFECVSRRLLRLRIKVR